MTAKDNPKTLTLISLIHSLHGERDEKRKKILAEIEKLFTGKPKLDPNSRLSKFLTADHPTGVEIAIDSPVDITLLIDDLDVLNILIKKGLDLSQMTLGNDYVLHRAIRLHATKCGLKLIEAGVDYLKTDEEGFTPLFLATSHGFSSLVSALCEKIKNCSNASEIINKRMKDGSTPLFISVQKGILASVKTLIETGANYSSAALAGLGVYDSIFSQLVLKETSKEYATQVNSQISLESSLEILQYLMQLGYANPLAISIEGVKLSVFHIFTQCPGYSKASIGAKLKFINMFLKAGAGLAIDESFKPWAPFYHLPDNAQFFILGASKRDSNTVKIFNIDDLERTLNDSSIEIDYQSIWHTLQRLDDKQLPCRSKVQFVLLSHYPQLSQLTYKLTTDQEQSLLQKAKPFSANNVPNYDGNFDVHEISVLFQSIPPVLNIEMAHVNLMRSLKNQTQDAVSDIHQEKSISIDYITYFNVYTRYINSISKICHLMMSPNFSDYTARFINTLKQMIEVSTNVLNLLDALNQFNRLNWRCEIEFSLFEANKFVERCIQKLIFPEILRKDLHFLIASCYAMQAERAFDNGSKGQSAHYTESALYYHEQLTQADIETDSARGVILYMTMASCLVKLGWLDNMPNIIDNMLINSNKFHLKLPKALDIINQYLQKLIALEKYSFCKRQTESILSKYSAKDRPQLVIDQLNRIRDITQQSRKKITYFIKQLNHARIICDDELVHISHKYTATLLRFLKSNLIDHAYDQQNHQINISIETLAYLPSNITDRILDMINTLAKIQEVIFTNKSDDVSSASHDQSAIINNLTMMYHDLTIRSKLKKPRKNTDINSNNQDDDSSDESSDDDNMIDDRDEIEKLIQAVLPKEYSNLIMIASPNDHARDNIFFCSVTEDLYNEYKGVLGKREDDKHRFTADSIPLHGVNEHGIKIDYHESRNNNAQKKKEFSASIKQGGTFRAQSHECIELEYQGKTIYCFLVASEITKDEQKRKIMSSKTKVV